MSDLLIESGVLRQEFKVQSWHVDFFRRARLDMLCLYFQEAAWNHAEALGFGFNRLAAERKMWVLSRLLLKVERLPLWGEAIRVDTWPSGIKSVFALRDFEMFDGAGSRLMAGVGAWLILDSETRRLKRIDQLLSSIPAVIRPRALNKDPGKLESSGTVQAGTFPVSYSDLDVNGHVNNARYIGWMLDSYGMDFHRTRVVKELEINFLGEAQVGDKVAVRSTREETGDVLSIFGEKNSEELCRARLQAGDTSPERGSEPPQRRTIG